MINSKDFIQKHKDIETSSKKSLYYASRAWFFSLLCAQVVFVLYLIGGYGATTLGGEYAEWNRFNSTAFKEADTLGNFIYAVHVLLAIVMILGGSLQLIPNIRKHFLVVHKINGRLFVVLACIISFAGMYLILFRGTVGNLFLHSMTFFSGILVIVASFFAVRAARGKRILEHQDWAMRLYLAANGVLFFRLLIFAWFMVFGTLGVDTSSFTGPTVYAISVCSYALPLIIYEWYRRSAQGRLGAKLLSICLLSISAIFLIGLLGITMGNWYPALLG